MEFRTNNKLLWKWKNSDIQVVIKWKYEINTLVHNKPLLTLLERSQNHGRISLDNEYSTSYDSAEKMKKITNKYYEK